MSDNVLIAVIAACGVVISAVLVFGGAIFAFVQNSKHLDKRLDRIDRTLEVIQADMRQWSEQIFKIKAHIKLD
jgi:hypothetical protein